MAALSAAVVLSGCGRRSVVGTVANVAGSAVSTTASVAGTAASGAANLAGTAVSAGSSAVSAGAAATSSAISAGSAAGAAGAGTAAGTSAGVNSAGLVAGTVGLGLAAGYDADSRSTDSAAQAEGMGNCLRAAGNAAQAAQLLMSAGWADGGNEGGNRLFTKNNVRAQILPAGHCVFRSEFASVSDADTAVRGLAQSLYPGGVTNGSPSGTIDSCSGFTVNASRQAWVHYTSSTGTSCVGGFGSGVTVQFL
ncbi:hypothetical protein [Marinibacterium profundimaris]|uniref:hypothetical protein n=1 Tax=Marinibacterium profundimaris TaxID=1679460 RepID=UPI000B525545|nr:hypothetical protein [Marinibacterium profundimaris]